MKALALALLSNAHESSLVWLGLGGNEITDRGAEHFAVALKAQHMTNGHLLMADGEEGTCMIIIIVLYRATLAWMSFIMQVEIGVSLILLLS